MTLALRRNPGQSVLLQTKDGLIQVKVRTNKDGQITLAIDAPGVGDNTSGRRKRREMGKELGMNLRARN